MCRHEPQQDLLCRSPGVTGQGYGLKMIGGNPVPTWALPRRGWRSLEPSVFWLRVVVGRMVGREKGGRSGKVSIPVPASKSKEVFPCFRAFRDQEGRTDRLLWVFSSRLRK